MGSTRALYAVVMAGGSGTRFWPASREARPKQFLAIAHERALLDETVRRLDGLVPMENVLVVAGAAHAELVRETLPDLRERNLLLEPAPRNTLPCVALAALEIARRDPEATQIVLPSDHVIEPTEAFQSTLRAAAVVAGDEGALVTIGVRPSHPATGYGYIEAGRAVSDVLGSEVFEVARFVEKPTAERAREFVAQGGFFWNAGIFVWTTEAIRAALEVHAPRTLAALAGVGSAAPDDLAAVYASIEAVSVDVGVMEKAGSVRVLPIAYTWSDVGSWSALVEVLAADETGNLRAGGGTLVTEDARGNVVYAQDGHLTALVGVEDLVVVHARGATLVVPKERAQDVRLIVERLSRLAPDKL